MKKIKNIKKEQQEKPFMTEVEAEEIIMATIIGVYRGNDSKLAHARLLLYSPRRIKTAMEIINE